MVCSTPLEGYNLLSTTIYLANYVKYVINVAAVQNSVEGGKNGVLYQQLTVPASDVTPDQPKQMSLSLTSQSEMKPSERNTIHIHT